MGLAINEWISIIVYTVIIILGILFLSFIIGISLFIGGIAGKSRKLKRAGLIVIGVSAFIIVAVLMFLYFSAIH